MLNKKRQDWRARATDADLKEAVRNSLQELLNNLLVAAKTVADASVVLTLEHPETSNALGDELGVAIKRIRYAGFHVQDAADVWDVILRRANPKLPKKRSRRKS
jgi:hypothetical protein